MLGGLYGLNIAQKGILLISQITPSIVTYLGVFKLEEYLFTLFLLQVTYAILPVFYIRYFSKEREIRAYLIDEFRGLTQQIKSGLSLCLSAFGMVTLSLIFTFLYEDEIIEYVKFPSQKNTFYIALFILLLYINAFMEEIFWRVFLMKTYKDSDTGRILINVFYASIHFVVLQRLFKDLEYSIGFSLYFYSIGGSFDHIRNKYGLITTLLAHYGLTIAFSLVLIIILYK